MALHPSIAAVRGGVRRALGAREPGETVLVACSGGPDSTALLAATIFEGHKLGLRVIGVTVDHGLQPESAEVSAAVVERMARMGADETAAARVQVDPAGIGPEAAARRARYAVLDQMREHFGAALVLLGHTRDDQAETVLLGLARGSGGRSLAGMRRSFDGYVRPLLDVGRDDTVTACQVEGLEVWNDPHNDDPGYTRVRVRRTVLPTLEEHLGPGVAATLARTADQIRDDVEALDDLAQRALADLDAQSDASGPGAAGAVPLRPLFDLHRAIASRVLRAAAVRAGVIDAELFHVHVKALLDLAAGDLSGQVQLPGSVTARREGGHLRFGPTRAP